MASPTRRVTELRPSVEPDVVGALAFFTLASCFLPPDTRHCRYSLGHCQQQQPGSTQHGSTCMDSPKGDSLSTSYALRSTCPLALASPSLPSALSPRIALHSQTFCRKLCVNRIHHWTHPTSDSALAHDERIRRSLIFEIQGAYCLLLPRSYQNKNFQVSVVATELSFQKRTNSV